MGGLEYQAIITTVAILNYWIKLFFPDEGPKGMLLYIQRDWLLIVNNYQ